MICPAPIDSTPQTAPKTFTNWARALSFTAARSYRPSTRGEIVEIIRQAEESGQRVKWTGSLWSFTGVFASEDVIIESDGITGVIDPALILERLPLTDESIRPSLAHVKGGTKVFNVNRLLHGLPAAHTGGGSDEDDLLCSGSERALPTLGGSGGQAIAGVMATGSHGGDIELPPIADCVQAIHLIGPGGQEFWIERSSGLTAGTEERVRDRLRRIIERNDAAAVEMCSDIIVRKDDDLFRAVLVSVGRMGFVYALVVKTVPAFKLREVRTPHVWENYRAIVDTELEAKYFLQILINPFGTGGAHDCTVAERSQEICDTLNENLDEDQDFFSWLCHQQDVNWVAAILVAAIAVLVAIIAGLVGLISVLAATASALLAIPIVGPFLAAAVFTAIAGIAAVIVATGVVIAALTALVGFIVSRGHLTPGELVAAIANFMFTVGLQDVMRGILVALFNGAYPLITKVGVGWKIMDTYGGYDGDDFCQKVDSIEIAFDVAAASGGGGYLAFIDEVFAIFDDLWSRRIAVAGILALRYTTRTEALIGMSKFPTTCHIEIPVLRGFDGNAEFLERVQRAARAYNGVPSWGQFTSHYTARDILDLHGADLTTWRRKLTQLIREGGGNRSTFSNSFTSAYNLEPFDDTPITAVRLRVTVGDDSLGDTDLLRPDVSADFARVTLLDWTEFEVSLNEGTEWRAHTTHERDVPVAPGTAWGDVRSVLIRHQAAGDDWNADNWTMDAIVISAVLGDGTTLEMARESDTPVWQFRKNDHQIWQHDFV